MTRADYRKLYRRCYTTYHISKITPGHRFRLGNSSAGLHLSRIALCRGSGPENSRYTEENPLPTATISVQIGTLHSQQRWNFGRFYGSLLSNVLHPKLRIGSDPYHRGLCILFAGNHER